jgi:predicted kinase
MPKVVLVSGAPGAGKSTLAGPLAERLGWPLLSKDIIKETLFDAVGQLDGDAVASSQRLGGAAMTLLWRLAACCPAVVLEANFRAGSQYERDRVTALCARPVEVYCRVPPELALRRYNERGARPDHHEVHNRRTIPIEALAEFQQPFGLGPVIEVDTARTVDIDVVAQLVDAALHET